MNALPFKPDRKLTEVLSQGFTLSAEIIPPRNGSEQRNVLDQILLLVGSGAEFLAVTKGAGGSLRGGSLPIAQAIKESFHVPAIAHFTCRDITPMEAENSLIDHHYFGIRNILALRGDPPDGQTDWKHRDGVYDYAYQLIEQIRDLNTGKYLKREGGPEADGQTPTDFCIGAAVYPEFPDEEKRVEYFRRKVEAGADYAITDMLFDPEAYARFRDLCVKRGVGEIPVLPGTRVLKTRGQAERMMKKFRVNVPPTTLAALPETDGAAALQIGMELFMKLTERLKQLGAPGIHVFVIADTLSATLALKRLVDWRKGI